MASHDLGKVGAAEGKPAVLQWRWFDSRPTLPLWIALSVLLVVPRENRKWQAWLILVIPLTALVLQLAVSSETAQFDLLIQWIVTFAIAWTSIWLLAPYLGKGNQWQAMLSALAVMLALGLVGYLSFFGFWCDSQGPAMTICFWLVGSVALLLGLALSGLCCRGSFRPGKIALWLIVWLPVITAVGMLASLIVMLGMVQGVPLIAFVVQVVASCLFMSLFGATFLYLVNLPVMLLAGWTECYRDRLRALTYREPLVQASLAEGNPFEKVNVHEATDTR